MDISLDNLQPLQGKNAWTNYPVGVTDVLVDAGMQMPVGYNIAIASTLPSGQG